MSIKKDIKVRIININQFSVDKEVDFNIKSEIFQELNEHISFFEKRGITMEISRIKIRDPTKFYEWIIERLYPQYKIIDHQGEGKQNPGVPDFELNLMNISEWRDKCSILMDSRDLRGFNEDNYNKDNLPKQIFIEVKRNGDGIHWNQLNWFLKYKGKKEIRILFIKEDDANGY